MPSNEEKTGDGSKPEKAISWETPTEEERRQILRDTIEERLKQQAVATNTALQGLQQAENPQFARHRELFLKMATDSAKTALVQIDALQWAISQTPDTPLPIDRITYPNKPIIDLPTVVATKLTPPPPNNQNP